MRIARHAVAALLWAATAHAAQAAPSENARLFGAREFVQHVSLSPDGRQLAYIIPAAGQGTRVVVQAAEPNAPTTTVLSLDGEPERALRCD